MKKSKFFKLIAILLLVCGFTFTLAACGETKPAETYYTVAFDSDGGTKVDSQRVLANEKATKPVDPTKVGFDFTGWFIEDEAFDFETLINEDKNLKAHWEEKVIITNFSVSFDSQGGSKVSTIQVQKGELVEKPADPVKEGFVFKGWYLNDEAFDFNTYKVNGTLTLVAKWEEVKPLTYKVSFDTKGGSLIDSVEVLENGQVTRPKDPTKDGYTFAGWYLDEVEYDFTKAITKDINLVAKWEAKSFTVSFDTKGGSEISALTVKYNNKVTRPEDPTKDGYTFAGWYLENALFDFTKAITKDITLVAKWKTAGLLPGDKEDGWDFVCTITYTGVEGIKPETIDEGQLASKPVDPVKEGYKFLGWYLGDELFDFNTPVYNDLVLTAKFSKIELANAETHDFANSLSKDGKDWFDETINDGPITYGCLPSKSINGKNPQMLVFPVRLAKENTYTNEDYTNMLKDINTVFNGTEAETGWESLDSYYKKSSYGKLDLDITINDEWFYDPSITSSLLKQMDEDYYAGTSDIDPNSFLMDMVLAHYDMKYDYSKFDSNDDGFIDSIWFVYDEPIDYEGDSMFWAYCAQSYNWLNDNGTFNEKYSYDGVYGMYYAWASVEFIYPEINQNIGYPVENIKIDAHTFIHESGHLMGLDDYYDYDDTVGPNNCGLYGADMMDANIGDHGVINKLLLDWIDPIEITGKGEVTVDLASFTTSGDAIIIADHNLNSIYDTYYLIEYYTNDGLNSNDMPILNGNGIRITLARAELYHDEFGDNAYNPGQYQTTFKYDNSDEILPFIDMVLPKNVQGEMYNLTSKHLFNVNSSYVNPIFTLTVNSITNGKINLTIHKA